MCAKDVSRLGDSSDFAQDGDGRAHGHAQRGVAIKDIAILQPAARGRQKLVDFRSRLLFRLLHASNPRDLAAAW